MIDRFGDRIQVAWSFKEDEWLKAIIEMGERPDHIQQLHELTGRSVRAILTRIYAFKKPEIVQANVRARRLWRQKLARCGVSYEPPAVL